MNSLTVVFWARRQKARFSERSSSSCPLEKAFFLDLASAARISAFAMLNLVLGAIVNPACKGRFQRCIHRARIASQMGGVPCFDRGSGSGNRPKGRLLPSFKWSIQWYIYRWIPLYQPGKLVVYRIHGLGSKKGWILPLFLNGGSLTFMECDAILSTCTQYSDRARRFSRKRTGTVGRSAESERRLGAPMRTWLF